MGLLEETGEYHTVDSNSEPGLVLDPFKGYILGERLDRRAYPSEPLFFEVRQVTYMDTQVNEPDTVRWRPALFIGGLLDRIVDSKMMDRVERALFK